MRRGRKSGLNLKIIIIFNIFEKNKENIAQNVKEKLKNCDFKANGSIGVRSRMQN